jgi:hypothetical protein
MNRVGSWLVEYHHQEVSVPIDLCRTTNRTDVSTQESGRDEISLRVGINLLAEAMRVAAIIRARAPDATHTYIRETVRQLYRNHIRLIKWGRLISNCLYARRWARRDWRVVPR